MRSGQVLVTLDYNNPERQAPNRRRPKKSSKGCGVFPAREALGSSLDYLLVPQHVIPCLLHQIIPCHAPLTYAPRPLVPGAHHLMTKVNMPHLCALSRPTLGHHLTCAALYTYVCVSVYVFPITVPRPQEGPNVLDGNPGRRVSFKRTRYDRLLLITSPSTRHGRT